MNLLDKAKSVPIKRTGPRVSTKDGALDLALALIRGEVTSTQAAVATNKNHQEVQRWAFRVISAGITNGDVCLTVAAK